MQFLFALIPGIIEIWRRAPTKLLMEEAPPGGTRDPALRQVAALAALVIFCPAKASMLALLHF